MMSGAAVDLTSSICFFEFMAKPSEFSGPDVFHTFGIVSAEDRGVVGHLHLDGERFQAVSAGVRVDEGEKLTDVISIGHDIGRRDVERGKCGVQGAKERFKGRFRVTSCVLGNIHEARILFQPSGCRWG